MVVPDHQVKRQEDAGQHGQPDLGGRPRAIGAPLENGDQAERRQGIRTPKDGRRGRLDVGEPHQDAGEGDRHRPKRRSHDRSIGQDAER